MKVFIDVSDEIILESLRGVTIVDGLEEADLIITDIAEEYQDDYEGFPILTVQSVDLSKSVNVDKLGRVPLLDKLCSESTLFVENIAVKSNKVSFGINGSQFAKREFECTDDGDVRINLGIDGNDQRVILKINRENGIVIPSKRDLEGYGTNALFETAQPKASSPIRSNVKESIDDIALALLDDVDSDTLTGKSMNESILGKSVVRVDDNGKQIQAPPAKVVTEPTEIKSEEDLHLYSSGLI